ncbi:hypothetical protein [Christiangramia aquimixticola]|uniref:hypothetical protein n=1 Tax=Christiangramia aquimixticola TaxID=1697558 RepID=UPI003AA9C9E3
MVNTRHLTIPLIVGGILLIPLIAMQFSTQVMWTTGDFVVMGLLLLVTGFTIDFILKKVRSTRNRIILCGIVLLILAIIWAELAVGIFDSPFAGS